MLLLTGTGPYVYRLEEEAAQVRRGELGTVPLSQLERECGLGD
ncbi:hypothetical protein [Corynebacterium belfantii]|nr:hypothetical protein [Corynebacterium belfantii]